VNTESQLTRPVYGDAGLSDAERAVVLQLAVEGVAAAAGVSPLAAAVALDEAAGRGAAHLVGDADRVAVEVDGEPLVTVSRDWLRVEVQAAAG
jgi:hypothetical protein